MNGGSGNIVISANQAMTQSTNSVISTTGLGTIVITATSSDITSNSNITTDGGSITLTAVAAKIAQNADVTSNGGAISYSAGSDIIIADGKLTDASSSGNSGTITMTAAQNVTTYTLKADGNVSLTATNAAINLNHTVLSEKGNLTVLANTTITQAFLADMTANEGNISLRATTGIITLNALSETKASGNITVTADAQDIVMNAGSSMKTAGGDITMSALLGLITSNDLKAEPNGNVTMTAKNDITVKAGLTAGGTGKVDLKSTAQNIRIESYVDGGTGEVSLNAFQSIHQNADVITSGNQITYIASSDIVMADGTKVDSRSSGDSGAITMIASQNITTYTLASDSHINLTATNAAINLNHTVLSEKGDITFIAKTDLTQKTGADVTATTGNITIKATTGTTETITLNAGMSAGGNIVVTAGDSVETTRLGSIVMNASAYATATGSGFIHFDAKEGAITTNNLSTTTDGEITINAKSDITVNNSLTANGSGKVDLISTSANILVNGAINGGSGVITMEAAGNIALDSVRTDSVISLNAGGFISDQLVSEEANLSADILNLVSVNGIGVESADINTSVNTLHVFNTGSGGIFINNSKSLNVLSASASLSSSALSLKTSGSLTVSGDITSSGSVSLGVSGSQNDLILEKTIVNQSGDITVSVGGSIYQNVDVQALNGDISYTAGGSFLQKDGVVLESKHSGAGKISVLAGKDIELSRMISEEGITLIAQTGSISDQSSAGENLVSRSAKLESFGSLGTVVDALDISVESVDLKSQTGGIFVAEADALILSYASASADIQIQSGSMRQSGNVSSASGSVRLDVGSDILMDKGTKTSVNDKTTAYLSGASISLSSLDAKSGHVDLKAGILGEISDSDNNDLVNVKAGSLNMIGHGVFGKGAILDDGLHEYWAEGVLNENNSDWS